MDRAASPKDFTPLGTTDAALGAGTEVARGIFGAGGFWSSDLHWNADLEVEGKVCKLEAFHLYLLGETPSLDCNPNFFIFAPKSALGEILAPLSVPVVPFLEFSARGLAHRFTIRELFPGFATQV